MLSKSSGPPGVIVQAEHWAKATQHLFIWVLAGVVFLERKQEATSQAGAISLPKLRVRYKKEASKKNHGDPRHHHPNWVSEPCGGEGWGRSPNTWQPPEMPFEKTAEEAAQQEQENHPSALQSMLWPLLCCRNHPLSLLLQPLVCKLCLLFLPLLHALSFIWNNLFTGLTSSELRLGSSTFSREGFLPQPKPSPLLFPGDLRALHPCPRLYGPVCPPEFPDSKSGWQVESDILHSSTLITSKSFWVLRFKHISTANEKIWAKNSWWSNKARLPLLHRPSGATLDQCPLFLWSLLQTTEV